MGLRIDLVEPFFGGSHRAWAEGWAAYSDHEVCLHTLPGSAWRWRMRGAAVTIAPRLVAGSEHRGPPDLLVVSDMVDLGDLLARTRRTHGNVPVALYLHENQLTYPRRPGEPLDTGLAWITWRNLTLADEIWCNSAFHRDELLAALPELLHDVPDHPHSDLLPGIASRMRVLPVGVDIPAPRPRSRPPLILSNQRWHHDKDVDAVVRALVWLADSGAEFRVAVVGDHRGGRAAEIDPLLDRLGDRVVARGLQDRATYESLVGRTDIVVSAARNEFFGIAVVEAVGAGAVPVLPDAVAYREVIPAEFHDVALYERGTLRPALAATLAALDDRRRAAVGLSASMTRFAWTVVAPTYDRAAAALAAIAPGSGR
jgi:glycosyltransferase involved in cell wall biosynthesis